MCLYPTFLKPFCFNNPCPYAPRLNLRTLFFGLTSFGWLHAIRGRRERVWAPEKKNRAPKQGRVGKMKIRIQCRQRRQQDGYWPQVPSTRQITTCLHWILMRKTKTYEIQSGPEAPCGPVVPGSLYRLPHSLLGTGSMRLILNYSIIS